MNWSLVIGHGALGMGYGPWGIGYSLISRGLSEVVGRSPSRRVVHLPYLPHPLLSTQHLVLSTQH